MRLLARNIDNQELLYAMQEILYFKSPLQRNHFPEPKNKYEEWRYKLKVGDRLDSLRGDDRFKCWGVAIVSFIYGDTLELQFEND